MEERLDHLLFININYEKQKQKKTIKLHSIFSHHIIPLVFENERLKSLFEDTAEIRADREVIQQEFNKWTKETNSVLLDISNRLYSITNETMDMDEKNPENPLEEYLEAFDKQSPFGDDTNFACWS